ncbi:MAG: indole-3-glycerol phosphate synthase TrpC [Actinomycetota bacterium]|nr:indole-3-glycerol phosphate synthase TrpC [Actinomycetota bacterium]MDQ3575472.1 indole-3-glycerol phosphate synthase TrpC [Actinomycetota bacterium]
MATYLDRIVAAHRTAAGQDARPLDHLIEAALQMPPARPFAPALRKDEALAVIAEVKRRSPSKGDLAPQLVPSVVAKAYADGGAACLSVLTDETFFGALPGDLEETRTAVDLPVLRKDFTVSARDVCDARLMGADAVLLIAAALDDRELAFFHRLATELGIDALVEVHDEGELDRALAVGATLVGVNQRDLTTFEVDGDRALRMAEAIPEEVVKVAESGITGPHDSGGLCQAGYHAVLVGESLVTSPDPAAAVRELRCAPCS